MGTGLSLNQLCVGYGSTSVLQPVTASAAAGLVTVVLGPNGSGKSTLLRTVAGLQPALAGVASIGTHNLLELSPRERATQVAVVLTDRFEAGLLRGREVVSLGRHPYRAMARSLTAADRAAIDTAMAAVHADQVADRLLVEMSDGQRQRIMIARALAQEPSLLILDEPSAFLDAPSRIELLAVLRGIAEHRNIPIVVSTHDVEAAVRNCQDGWVIVGDQLHEGTVESLAQKAIGAAFDTPAVRFDTSDTTFRLRH